ncbi:hypothetical protein [Clostridium estertheticum]|uniref:Transmembrane protein n=1 Tax=Clostridium estertheticum TaxID=238834 RepID=A0AA47I5U9_9CLOT|nr:hypothetical protein [Clostridium estertheticum]MBU3155005.1 hypothetical protein [Clostridium estertheticum]WAG58824.1 hypothetical protein LL038_14295 [Clostridium estertheticum]
MTEIRDYLVIITTLLAILIGFSGFFLNFTYDMLFNDFIIGIKQTSKKDTILRISVFLGMLFYAIIIIFIIASSKPNTLISRGASSKYLTSKYSTFSLYAFVTICIIYLLIYTFVKVNFVKMLNKKKTPYLSLFLWVAITLSVICVCTSIVGSFSEMDMNNKVYRISVYRDDLFIGSIFSKQQTVMSKDDSIQMKMNDLIISDGHLQTINGNKKGIFSLVYDGKRYFVNNSNVNSTIEIVDGDIVTLDIKNINVGNLTYNHNTSSAKVTFILKLIFLFLTFYSLVFFGFGLRSILEKVNSIKIH